MTVDTAVKVEGEKCGLDMRSSYEDLPPTSVGGGGSECNGDGKDDYVFVNDSDAASDDHGEVEGNNGELNVSESNAEIQGKMEGGALNVNGGDQLDICNGFNGKLDDVVKLNGGESKLENEVIVEEESGGIGESVKENGETKSEYEGTIEEREAIVENGDRNYIENEVDFKVRDLEVVEQSYAEPAVDEVKNGELGVDKGDDCNASADGICYPSLDDDDKNKIVLGIDGSDKVQNGTTVVEPEPHVPHGEIEEQLHLGSHDERENQTKEPEKLEDEVGKPEGIENNVNPHIDEVLVTDSKPGGSFIRQSEPLEANFSHQSQEDGHIETQPPDGDFKAKDSGDKVLLPDDVVTEKQLADCLSDLQPADSAEIGPVETEAEVREQSYLNPMRRIQDFNSLDSEGTVCEPQQSDENQDASDLTTELEECLETQDVPEQSEGADNQSNSELIASELDVGVLESTVQSDETTAELISEVKGTLETSTMDIQSDNPDKCVVDHELDRVHGEGKPELIAQVGGSLESSDQGAEETGLVDVIDKEVSSEDASSKKAVTAEEASNLLILKSADDAAIDEESKDVDAGHLEVGVSGNEVDVPESSHDSGSCLRSKDGDLAVPVGSEVDLPVSSDSDIIREQGVVSDGSHTGDNGISCSAVEFDSQPNLEISNSTVPYPVNGADSEVKPVNGEFDVACKTSFDSEGSLKPKISFGSFECIAPFSHNDSIIHTDELNRSNEFTSIRSEISGEISKSIAGTANGVTLPNSEANVVNFTEVDHKTCPGAEASEQTNVDEVSASPRGGSGADSVDGLNVNPDLVRRPFYYLIRIPRFDDVKLTEQIKECDMEVKKKTLDRDAVRKAYQERKAAYWEVQSNYDAAKSEERAAHKLMTAKKREIDSALSLINLARNAVTVEDVDGQILNLERMIQHETLDLAEEKKLIRDIKRLKNQREQLAANTGRQQELHQALDRRVETEERLKVLRKELDALRDNHAKAEEIFKPVKAKYDLESSLLNDLYVELKSLNTIRQQAYAELQELKNQAFEKNKLFYYYKDDTKAAFDYAKAGEMENLEQHCVNQVEKFMELWNKNDDFRKEYIRCNMKSTLRRLRTLDGRSLGPDEEPPLLGFVSDNRANASAKVNSVGMVSSLERDFPLVAKKAGEESSKKVIEQKNKPPLAKKKGEPSSKNSLAEPSGRIEMEEKEEENNLTKEEEELARKAEEKKREEEAAQLREKLREEERAKARQALERKQKMAMKAQMKAEFKARKEAEEKKKEMEKRAKKKRNKGLAAETAETEPSQLPESSSETNREPEVTEKPVTVAKKSHKPALYTKQVKTTKSILAPPAPLRNRSKRRMPQWAWWLVLAVLTVLLIFPLGNIDIVGLLKPLVSGSSN